MIFEITPSDILSVLVVASNLLLYKAGQMQFEELRGLRGDTDYNFHKLERKIDKIQIPKENPELPKDT
jgi:hypothetical protein